MYPPTSVTPGHSSPSGGSLRRFPFEDRTVSPGFSTVSPSFRTSADRILHMDDRLATPSVRYWECPHCHSVNEWMLPRCCQCAQPRPSDAAPLAAPTEAQEVAAWATRSLYKTLLFLGYVFLASAAITAPLPRALSLRVTSREGLAFLGTTIAMLAIGSVLLAAARHVKRKTNPSVQRPH